MEKKYTKKLNNRNYLDNDNNLEYRELFNALYDTNAEDLLKVFVDHLKQDHNFSYDQIADLFGKKIPKKDTLPISIFDNKELSCLGTIVKFLKEEFKLSFHEIALLLNRNDRTIWSTYYIAHKKRKEKLLVKYSKFFIPVSIFRDRKFSVLEALVGYLKDNFNLRYSEIAILLKRDERNMWTVYSRYKKKK